jgi:Icc protein
MSADRQLPPELCFAQISDPHICDQASAELVRRVVPELNRLRPDFVAFTGDLVDDGTPEACAAFEGAIAELEAPGLFVIGNHDMHGGKAVFEERLGPLNAGLDFGPYHVIVLDSTDETEITWGGGFTEASVEWLRGHLARVPSEQALILFTHHGIYSDQPHEPKVNLFWDVLNWEPVHEALAGRRLVLACAGHAHENARFERDGTVYLVTSCLSSTRAPHGSDPPGYRVVELRDGQVQTQYNPVSIE